MSFVVKTLPELFKGNISRIKLIVADKIKKFSILFSLKSFKFLKIKIQNKKAIINIKENPTMPVSVNTST